MASLGACGQDEIYFIALHCWYPFSAEKGVLQEKIISIKAQLADEEFSNKKKNTELLQKLQTFELKMYQMKTEFLNAQDHFESIIVVTDIS